MKNWMKVLVIILILALVISSVTIAAISIRRNQWKKTDKPVDTQIAETALPNYADGKVFEIYLNQKAEDAGTGTKDAPFSSIEDALGLIEKTQKDAGDYMAIRLNVSGLFELSEAVDFESKHTENLPLIIQGEEDATFSGGTSFMGGWSEYKDGIYQRPLQADPFRTLYVNGQGQQRSRFPNKTEDPKKCVLTGEWHDEARTLGVDKKIQKVLPEDISSVCDHLEIFIAESWTQCIAKPTKAETNRKYIDFHFPEHLEKGFFEEVRNSKKAKPYVWIENDLSLLDVEGEWYYDTENGMLYYKPFAGEDINKLSFTIPKLSTLLTIQGTKENKADKIFFSNVGFAYSNWNYPSYNGMIERQATNFYNTTRGENEETFLLPENAIYINEADNITFYDCTIQNIGATGIRVDGASNHFMMKCNTVKNIGGSAMVIGCFERELEEAAETTESPYIKENLASDIIIEDNYIAHVGQLYMGGIGVQIGLATDAKVQHNEVYDVTYSGMSIGWGWTADPVPRENIQVCNNKIHNTMNNLIFDGAGVYFLGQFPKDSVQNRFSGNYVVCGNGYSGLYFDEGSQNFLATNNVIEGEGLVGWLLIHDIEYLAGDLEITHNYTCTKDYHINSWSRDANKKKVKPEDRNVSIQDTCVKRSREAYGVGAQSIIDNAGIRDCYLDLVKED